MNNIEIKPFVPKDIIYLHRHCVDKEEPFLIQPSLAKYYPKAGPALTFFWKGKPILISGLIVNDGEAECWAMFSRRRKHRKYLALACRHLKREMYEKVKELKIRKITGVCSATFFESIRVFKFFGFQMIRKSRNKLIWERRCH